MSLGRWIIVFGLILIVVGVVVTLTERFSFFRLGRLPGDFVYRGKNVVFYFPLATSILLSVLLTLVLSLIFRKR